MAKKRGREASPLSKHLLKQCMHDYEAAALQFSLSSISKRQSCTKPKLCLRSIGPMPSLLLGQMPWRCCNASVVLKGPDKWRFT